MTAAEIVHQYADVAGYYHDQQQQALAALTAHAASGGQVTPWQAGYVVGLVADLTALVRALANTAPDAERKAA